MKKLISLALTCALLSSCSLFRIHKMDVQQGNLYDQAEVSRLRTGMSTSEVKAIIGEPVMVNVLADNRLDYVYTNQPGHEEMSVKRLTCLFQNNRLVKVEQN